MEERREFFGIAMIMILYFISLIAMQQKYGKGGVFRVDTHVALTVAAPLERWK